MELKSQDISVVVQGPIDWSFDGRYLIATTRALCLNIRRLLPDAEIIISTWIGQQYDSLDFDVIILTEDPGQQGSWPSFTPSNLNRQVTSAVKGLKASIRPYCLKVRSDIVLEGTDFLDVYARLAPIEPDPRRLFVYPIVSNNLTSRNTPAILERIPDHPLLFHPSDHAHFGRREDLLALWDVPLQSEEDALFFMDISQPNRWRYFELARLAPEQHILTKAIEKRMNIAFPHYACSSPEMVEMSRYYMTTHFMFLPDRAFPIHFAKYHTEHHSSFEWMRINPDPVALKASKAKRSLKWKLTFPSRNPAGFRRWLKRIGKNGLSWARVKTLTMYRRIFTAD